jgi:hypothetical protein
MGFSWVVVVLGVRIMDARDTAKVAETFENGAGKVAVALTRRAVWLAGMRSVARLRGLPIRSTAVGRTTVDRRGRSCG